MKVSRRHNVCAEIVKELLKSGANPNICDERNMAPLNYICARSQNIHAISYLIDCGSDLNRKNTDFGESPLHHAFCLGNVEITKKLLQHGADPNATNNLKETSLHLLAQNPEQIEVKFQKPSNCFLSILLTSMRKMMTEKLQFIVPFILQMLKEFNH